MDYNENKDRYVVYSVEDNPHIREIITATLESANMMIKCYNDYIELARGLALRKPDLILLDIMLPEQSGEEILVELKANTATSSIPVIIISALGSEMEKVRLLNKGANDYLTKPFGVLELIARVKTNLKHVTRYRYESGEYLIDFGQHIIFKSGAALDVTVKEFQLLSFLIQNRGRAIEKKEILDTVWGADFEGEERGLNMYILRLRAKLGNDVISTVREVGFRMN